MCCRTTLLVALRKADLTAIDASKKKAFQLLHADVQAALPRGSAPSVVALYVASATASASSGGRWLKAQTADDDTLQGLASRIAGLGRAPPAATGTVATRALLEKQFSGRQQAAAQGMLSMLQLRCDGARHCFEVCSPPDDCCQGISGTCLACASTIVLLADCMHGASDGYVCCCVSLFDAFSMPLLL